MNTYRPGHRRLAQNRKAYDRMHHAQRSASCRNCGGAVVYWLPNEAPERCFECEQGRCAWPYRRPMDEAEQAEYRAYQERYAYRD